MFFSDSKGEDVHQPGLCRVLALAVTLPLGLLSWLKLQPWLTGSPTKRAAVSVTASRKPERGPLSCCSHGPPEGPQHPLIKYTSPASNGTPAGRTLLWEGDTGRTECRESSWGGREERERMDEMFWQKRGQGGRRGRQSGKKEVQTLRSALISREGHLINRLLKLDWKSFYCAAV